MKTMRLLSKGLSLGLVLAELLLVTGQPRVVRAQTTSSPGVEAAALNPALIGVPAAGILVALAGAGLLVVAVRRYRQQQTAHRSPLLLMVAVAILLAGLLPLAGVLVIILPGSPPSAEDVVIPTRIAFQPTATDTVVPPTPTPEPTALPATSTPPPTALPATSTAEPTALPATSTLLPTEIIAPTMEITEAAATAEATDETTPESTATPMSMAEWKAQFRPPDKPATRLMIPALGVDTVLVEARISGNTWDVSRFYQEVAHLEGTAYPGTTGNAVLAGHVTTLRGAGPFRHLADLKPGDLILAKGDGVLYRYVVMSVRVVDPSDVSVTYPQEGASLTLLTCTDWDRTARAYTQRLVVRAQMEPGTA